MLQEQAQPEEGSEEEEDCEEKGGQFELAAEQLPLLPAASEGGDACPLRSSQPAAALPRQAPVRHGNYSLTVFQALLYSWEYVPSRMPLMLEAEE